MFFSYKFHISSCDSDYFLIVSEYQMSKTISERARITSLQLYARYDVVSGSCTRFQCKESLHKYSKSISMQQIIPPIPWNHNSTNSNVIMQLSSNATDKIQMPCIIIPFEWNNYLKSPCYNILAKIWLWFPARPYTRDSVERQSNVREFAWGFCRM